MTESVLILGRQPALGLAELESLFGAPALTPLGPNCVRLAVDPATVDLRRLGGSVKLAKLLTVLDTTKWPELVDYLVNEVPEHLQYLPDGKVRFGLNAYDVPVSTGKLNAAGLSVKKAIQAAGRSVRAVPVANGQTSLSSAQTLHNQLTGPTGMELTLIKAGSQTVLAQVVAVQDIAAYAARDQARPKRDAKVGMLPPKLAQILLNLAVGQQADSQLTVLDPFCGTGVVLQEADLMGYSVYGTDLEPRMIDYSKQNLDWLAGVGHKAWRLAVGDATDFTWNSFDAVATETYLGRPFSAAPDPATLQKVIKDVDTIHRKFLKNLGQQTKPGLRACLAVPAWFTKSGVNHLPVLDSLEKMRYTRTSFVHAARKDLIYHRPGQIVGRELVVITRK